MTLTIEDVVRRPVSRETIAKLREYEHMVRTENEVQNLVSRGTMEDFWERHVLDSAQLVRFEPEQGCSWADVGSGAGLPGIVVACLVGGKMLLIEPRKLRAAFLQRVVDALELNAQVFTGKAEALSGAYRVITARAVAPLSKLIQLSQHLSTTNSLMVFPKGRSAQSELAEAQRSWQGSFHVEPSLIDADSRIILARDVRPQRK